MCFDELQHQDSLMCRVLRDSSLSFPRAGLAKAGITYDKVNALEARSGHSEGASSTPVTLPITARVVALRGRPRGKGTDDKRPQRTARTLIVDPLGSTATMAATATAAGRAEKATCGSCGEP